jgi:hypothetical protein
MLFEMTKFFLLMFSAMAALFAGCRSSRSGLSFSAADSRSVYADFDEHFISLCRQQLRSVLQSDSLFISIVEFFPPTALTAPTAPTALTAPIAPNAPNAPNAPIAPIALTAPTAPAIKSAVTIRFHSSTRIRDSTAAFLRDEQTAATLRDSAASSRSVAKTVSKTAPWYASTTFIIAAAIALAVAAYFLLRRLRR